MADGKAKQREEAGQPVYDVLEEHGIQPCLVNPRNMKNVPGKGGESRCSRRRLHKSLQVLEGLLILQTDLVHQLCVDHDALP